MAEENTEVVPVEENNEEDTPVEEKTVPIAVIEKMRQENNDLKQNMGLMQQQMSNIQDSANQIAENNVPSEDGEEIMTRDQVKEMVDAGNVQANNGLSEMAMRVQHSDYNTVINTNLQNVIKAKPHLLNLIKTSHAPHVLAYELGITDPAYTTVNPADLAGKIKANQDKPGSVNKVSRGGQISSDSKYKTMASVDFEKEVDKVLAGLSG